TGGAGGGDVGGGGRRDGEALDLDGADVDRAAGDAHEAQAALVGGEASRDQGVGAGVEQRAVGRGQLGRRGPAVVAQGGEREGGGWGGGGAGGVGRGGGGWGGPRRCCPGRRA